MIKRMLIGTVATTTLFGGAAAVFPASADAGMRLTSTGGQEGPGARGHSHGQVRLRDHGDNVDFRDQEGASLGQIHQGQKMDVYWVMTARSTADGSGATTGS